MRCHYNSYAIRKTIPAGWRKRGSRSLTEPPVAHLEQVLVRPVDLLSGQDDALPVEGLDGMYQGLAFARPLVAAGRPGEHGLPEGLRPDT